MYALETSENNHSGLQKLVRIKCVSNIIVLYALSFCLGAMKSIVKFFYICLNNGQSWTNGVILLNEKTKSCFLSETK